MWEKHLKKKVRKGPAFYIKSHSGTVLFPLVQTNHRFSLQTAPLTILDLLLIIKCSYFLFFTYVKCSRSTIAWTENLPHINKFFRSSFSFTSPAARMPNGYICCHNLTMKFPPDFHNYTGLYSLWIPSPNCSTKWIDLCCKPHWPAKRKKWRHVRSGCKEMFRKKAFLKISQNSQRNTCKVVSF